MKSQLLLRIATCSLCFSLSTANSFSQGYESADVLDFLGPSYFNDIFETDSTYTYTRSRFYSLALSGGYVNNYQFRNSFTHNAYTSVLLTNVVSINNFQLNYKVQGFFPANDGHMFVRSRLQGGIYFFSKKADIAARRRYRKTGDALYAPSIDLPRLLVAYNTEYHRDSVTYHEIGLEYAMHGNFKKQRDDMPFDFDGGYFLAWRLNTRDFLYGIAYSYIFDLDHKMVNRFYFHVGVFRNRVNKKDRWGNVKLAGVLSLNSLKIKSGVKVFYAWTRNLHQKFNNNEIGIFIDIRPFSALNFISFDTQSLIEPNVD
jgi:hypothetical protein